MLAHQLDGRGNIISFELRWYVHREHSESKILIHSDGAVGTVSIGCRQRPAAATFGWGSPAAHFCSLAHDLVSEWCVDKDFVIFGSVDSDTDHLLTASACRYSS
jgi:hypothetical protein